MYCDENDNIETHWIACHLTDNRVNHFDKFGVAHIPEGIYLFTG